MLLVELDPSSTLSQEQIEEQLQEFTCQLNQLEIGPHSCFELPITYKPYLGE